MKILILLTLLLSSQSYARTCVIEAKAIVEVLEFTIEGCQIEGDLKAASQPGTYDGIFTMDLTRLITDDDLRTEHMHDKYLTSKKFPKTSLYLYPVKAGDKEFTADLTLRSITKKIKGKLDFDGKKLKADFFVKITDFGMEKPGYGPIVIGENIRVLVTL